MLHDSRLNTFGGLVVVVFQSLIKDSNLNHVNPHLSSLKLSLSYHPFRTSTTLSGTRPLLLETKLSLVETGVLSVSPSLQLTSHQLSDGLLSGFLLVSDLPQTGKWESEGRV